MAKPDPLTAASARMRPLPHLIFTSLWLPLPSRSHARMQDPR